MKVLPFNYGETKKYIIFSRNGAGTAIIHYVYKINTNKKLTELTVYNNGNIEYITTLNSILDFNDKNPLESIKRFFKILIIQAE